LFARSLGYSKMDGADESVCEGVELGPAHWLQDLMLSHEALVGFVLNRA
jgi:hypothetical protein